MRRSLRIFLMAFVLVLILTVRLSAQVGPISNRILHPIGTPTNPIRLKVLSSNTYRISPTETARPLPALPINKWITFPDFMKQVEEANLALAAQRYNIPIAKAQLTMASVYPDPDFQAGYGGDVSNERQPTTYSGSLSQEIVLGGKIGAREEVAQAALSISDANLADYLRALRAQAADAFVDALIGLLRLHRDAKSLERARELIELNVEHQQKGQASEDSVMRARISELEAHSNLADAQSALHQTLGTLTILMGQSRIDGLIAPLGDLEGSARAFSL
jgi:cobalt-zinc-cadmium efflux system outer membrane protein